MATLTDSNKRCKACGGGLDNERIEQLWEYLKCYRSVVLNEDEYRSLRMVGFTPRQVDRAAKILSAEGRVRIEPSPYGLSVEIIAQGASSCPA